MKIKEIFLSKDDDDKVELINSLNFDDYEDKWDLILEVIEDKNEYDLVRIEALKVIEIIDVPEIILNKLCKLIFKLLKNEEDYDVRNYAFIASRNLINDSEEIKNLISEIVLSKEDIDIRHNAYSAVLSINDEVDKNNVLKLFLDNSDFSSFAKKDIS